VSARDLVDPDGVIQVSRARSCIGEADYLLGQGNYHGVGRSPYENDIHPLCDCSGYRAWVGMYDRRQVIPKDTAKKCGLDFDDLKNGNVVVYFNCDNIVKDATGKYHWLYVALKRTDKVRPGDVLVHAPLPGKAHGHVVGAITALAPDFELCRGKPGWGKKVTIVHCSSWTKEPNIRETDARVFEKAGNAYYVRQIQTPVLA
jgi:hypothetical protein